MKLADILKTAGEVAPTLAHEKNRVPVVTMVSYAIIYRHGLAKYVADAKAAGIAGAIVPDLLVEESAEFSNSVAKKTSASFNW